MEAFTTAFPPAKRDVESIYPSTLLRPIAEAVRLRFALLDHQNEIPEAANDGYQIDEDPTAALANVVQAAHVDGQGGREQCQSNEAVKHDEDVIHRPDVAQKINQQAEGDADDGVHKDVLPEHCARGTPPELRILIRHCGFEICNHVVHNRMWEGFIK